MSRVRRHRHLVGFLANAAEQPCDVPALQQFFTTPLPAKVLDFMTALADCVLYYRFDAATKSGKTKTYSHFVTTNIGPVPGEETYQPASIVGFLRRYRERNMPPHYLPLVNDFNKTSWLFCDVRPETGNPILVHRDELHFDAKGTGWTVVSTDFDSFVDGLQLDLRPLLSIFRIAGLGGVQEPMREWLEAALGSDWDAKIRIEMSSKTKRRT